MPYYIYQVKPFAQLQQLAMHASFAPASNEAKVLRSKLPAESPDKVKVIFAETPEHAEDLLCQIRDPNPDPAE